jgi:hypothetical protein
MHVLCGKTLIAYQAADQAGVRVSYHARRGLTHVESAVLPALWGEGAFSRSSLTEGSTVGYVQILKKGLLIWRKCGNWSRRTIFGLAAPPIRGSKSMAEPVLGDNYRHL